METYTLGCRYDSRNSFYGKAIVVETREKNYFKTVLYSYNTEVGSVELFYDECGLEVEKAIYKYYGRYSQTTTRHQKEFFRQQGLMEDEIDELFKNGSLIREY